jgi:hypothetical protein
VLDDDALPVEWRGIRRPTLAACLARMATHLERDGHRRAGAGGHAAYALAGRALCLTPGDAALRELFTAQVGRAGLAVPALPFHAVCLPRLDPAEIRAAVAHARALDAAGLLASVAVGVRAGDLERAVGLIEPELAAGPEIGIDLVAGDDPRQLLLPGTVLLARHSSPQAGEAEAHGIPALLHGVPDPFAREADPERYETLPATA